MGVSLARGMNLRAHGRIESVSGLAAGNGRFGEGAARIRQSGIGQHLGQAPVHDLDLAERADHDVGRLQVAVDDAVGVGVADRLADLLEHRQEPAAVGRRVGPPSEQVVEGLALDELHRQERPAVGQRADLVDRRDAGVLQLAGDPGLVEEPAGVAESAGNCRAAP